MTYHAGDYDVIVIGAGHAGCEAALAAAKMGSNTLMLSLNLDMIAFMPCNPSLGGPAKGIVIREIDALGGAMGTVIDQAYIQMRMLNTRKGPAVQALRAQADKPVYVQKMKHLLENEPNVTLKQAMVEKLIIEDGICKGVKTDTNAIYYGKSIVITTGTFMRGKILIGEMAFESGPNNQRVSKNLPEQMEEIGFDLTRFQTGTPPRVNGHTIDYDQTIIQPGDDDHRGFSFETTEFIDEQIPCWLTYTTEKSHKIINDNLTLSSMYSGMEEGTGPRYCPSIEDKIVRFHDKPRHQIFLEPEGKETEEVYVQGLSTSLPESIQYDLLRSIPGLEEVEMMRPGYAIEYDSVIPTQLLPTLESKAIEGLYTAGQINGTSGYEEAAAQGLMAGINAALKIQDKEPFVLDRSQGYIGVMIDDLVTKGTREPYRLLTSRAEYRLLLRHDNADLRLTELGYELGLISEERYGRFKEKLELIEAEKTRLHDQIIKVDDHVQEVLKSIPSTPLRDATRAYALLKRPEVKYKHLEQMFGTRDIPLEVKEQVETQIKYEGYIKKANEQVERMLRMEDKKIPKNIDYDAVTGLATEAREKLKQIQPLSIGQASRISGVNPADVSILLVYIEQGNVKRTS